MKKILFFLFLLPAALASAQTAKDTVNVLTDAEISAGTLVDSVKMYYIQGSAWKKSRMDSLAAYMATKNGLGVTNGNKGDITVSSAGATWTINTLAVTAAKLADSTVTGVKIASGTVGTTNIVNSAVTGAKLAADAVDSTKIVNAGVAYADLSQPVKDSLASYQRKITLTTTGTSGAATLTGATLNIPQYAGNTDLSYSGTSSPVTLQSSTGNDVTITAGTGISLSANSGNVTITNTVSGVSDGDKGDITVSASGATWTIDNSVVTGAKIASDAVDSTKISTSGIGRTDLRDSIITGAKIAQTTIPGVDMAITGMTGDAARLVGAITGGNLDTVRVGSGLQLSSGELRADTAAMIIACSDETTNLTTGTAKVTFRAPFAFTILGVRASVKTAPTGANLIVDINEGDPPSATSIMTTNKLVIEATEKTSLDATTQPGITDTSIANDAVVTIDIDQIGSTVAGVALKVVILYRKN